MNKKKVLIPSFKFERKTKAFNRVLWGFVSLFCMFSTTIIYIFHLMICSISNIVSTVILDSDTLLIYFVFGFGIIFGVLVFKFLNMLLHSYKIEDDKIIKGRILNVANIKGDKLLFDAAITNYMFKNLDNPSSVFKANTISNTANVIELISLNINPDFVNNFFDTELYKKKVYNNPKLLQEDKYFLTYICENNKKLRIPKIYDGIVNTSDDSNESSLIKRILVRSLVVSLIILSFSVVDLVVGYDKNNGYINNITNVSENIIDELDLYGYSVKKHNEKLYEFNKTVSNDRTSKIKYYFDRNGKIIDVDFDLYFINSNNVEDELYYVIKSLNDDFTDYEINEFISHIISCINGNCSYSKLISNSNTIRINTSGGFIHIHN